MVSFVAPCALLRVCIVDSSLLTLSLNLQSSSCCACRRASWLRTALCMSECTMASSMVEAGGDGGGEGVVGAVVGDGTLSAVRVVERRSGEDDGEALRCVAGRAAVDIGSSRCDERPRRKGPEAASAVSARDAVGSSCDTAAEISSVHKVRSSTLEGDAGIPSVLMASSISMPVCSGSAHRTEIIHLRTADADAPSTVSPAGLDAVRRVDRRTAAPARRFLTIATLLAAATSAGASRCRFEAWVGDALWYCERGGGCCARWQGRTVR